MGLSSTLGFKSLKLFHVQMNLLARCWNIPWGSSLLITQNDTGSRARKENCFYRNHLHFLEDPTAGTIFSLKQSFLLEILNFPWKRWTGRCDSYLRHSYILLTLQREREGKTAWLWEAAMFRTHIILLGSRKASPVTQIVEIGGGRKSHY